MIKDLLENGSLVQGRNGNTLCSIGCGMHFSLENNSIPILTTKKVAVKTCLKELIWFIRAHTDNTLLNEKKVHIWDLNGTREFLDSRGLTKNAENDLGPIYGHQWRHFNAEYKDCHQDYSNQGVDQLQK